MRNGRGLIRRPETALEPAHPSKAIWRWHYASQRLFKKPSVDDAALAKALSALGRSRLAANMNQLAKATNMGRLTLKPDAEQELSQACADIAAMRSALLKALGLREDV